MCYTITKTDDAVELTIKLPPDIGEQFAPLLGVNNNLLMPDVHHPLLAWKPDGKKFNYRLHGDGVDENIEALCDLQAIAIALGQSGSLDLQRTG